MAEVTNAHSVLCPKCGCFYAVRTDGPSEPHECPPEGEQAKAHRARLAFALNKILTRAISADEMRYIAHEALQSLPRESAS